MGKVDLKKNADGTITAVYILNNEKRLYSFKDEPWYTDADRFDQAKWGFVGLGVPIDPGSFELKRLRKRPQQ